MEQRITVVVTAPDGTNGITDAIAFALDNPMNYPDDVDTDDWCVYVPAENSKPEPETEILTMPPVPWINLPPDEHYAWNCALGRAITYSWARSPANEAESPVASTSACWFFLRIRRPP